MKKKVAIFTGNRAEYGLLKPLIYHLQDCKEQIELTFLISGAHLDKFFGETVKEIRKDFSNLKEIFLPHGGDALFDTAQAIGNCILLVSQELKKNPQDFFIVYGDRFETFGAAVAASQMKIPLIHIEGGDITEGGALDDNLRHAITKLAHLHFTTNEQAYKNVLSLGEEAWRVKNVGIPSLDSIVSGKFANLAELKEFTKLDFSRPVILFTQHAETADPQITKKQIFQSLAALEHFLKKDVDCIITYPNNDAGGILIIDEIHKYFENWPKDVRKPLIIPALGSRNYHGVLSLARDAKFQIACVGNSSSGIKETPIFGCPTLNLGSRQQGRIFSTNVLNATYDTLEIIKKIEICLFDTIFREQARNCKNPYGDGTASKKIVDEILNAPVDKLLIKKHVLE